jgi:hypothetical protein
MGDDSEPGPSRRKIDPPSRQSLSSDEDEHAVDLVDPNIISINDPRFRSAVEDAVAMLLPELNKAKEDQKRRESTGDILNPTSSQNEHNETSTPYSLSQKRPSKTIYDVDTVSRKASVQEPDWSKSHIEEDTRYVQVLIQCYKLT